MDKNIRVIITQEHKVQVAGFDLDGPEGLRGVLFVLAEAKEILNKAQEDYRSAIAGGKIEHDARVRFMTHDGRILENDFKRK